MAASKQLTAGLRNQRNTPFQWLYFPRNPDVHACFTLLSKLRTIARYQSSGQRTGYGTDTAIKSLHSPSTLALNMTLA
jgi:hypothetical protein